MVKSYRAGVTPLNRKLPSDVDKVCRTKPVATLFNSTLTFGKAELVGSITVPCKVAPVLWAKAQPHATATVSTTNRTRLQFIVDLLTNSLAPHRNQVSRRAEHVHLSRSRGRSDPVAFASCEFLFLK